MSQPHQNLVNADTVNGTVLQAHTIHAHNILVSIGDVEFAELHNDSILKALEGQASASVENLIELVLRYPAQVEAAIAAAERMQTAPGAELTGARLTEIQAALDQFAQRMPGLATSARSHGEKIHSNLVKLMDVRRRLAGTDPPAGTGEPTARSPYPGLKSFTRGQAAFFCGRGEATSTLLVRMAEQEQHGLPLLVMGVSGAGKSSLLRAGLVPALRRGGLPGSRHWPCWVVRPGDRPLRSLVRMVARWARTPVEQAVDEVRAAPESFARLVRDAVETRTDHLEDGGTRRAVLVVDQFEEIFQPSVDTAERDAFLAAVRAAARLAADRVGGPAALVALGVRADAYAQCAATPLLADALRRNQFLVEAMNGAELRQAVEDPAALAGCTLDDGLAQQMIDDLGAGAGGYEPGALPLLAFALEATWERRRNGVLTLAGYRQSGGVRGAVAQKAERLFTTFSAPERRVLRTMMLSMVAIGDGMHDSRRTMPRAGLVGDDATAAAVLDRLVAERLVTSAGHGQVELVHEALLTHWPRLGQWLAETRPGMVIRDRLMTDARLWSEHPRDNDMLYGGTRLAGARELVEDADRFMLGPGELAFVAASVRADERRRADAKRQLRRFQWLSIGIGSFLVLALVAGAVAAVQWRRADRSQAEARSRQYAAESTAAAAASPRRAMMLALRAYDAAPTAEATGALLSAGMSGYAGEVGDGGDAVAVSPDGSLVAVGSDDGVRVWRTEDHRELEMDRVAARQEVHTLAFSPNGRMLATASVGVNSVAVWEMPSGRLVTRLAGSGAVAWRADGQRLVAAAPARDTGWVLRFWRTDTWQVTAEIEIPGIVPLRVAVSPVDDLVAVGGGNGETAVWHGDGRFAWRQRGDPDSPMAVAWSPDGRTVVSGGTADDRVRFWDAVGTQVGQTSAGDGGIASVAYAPGGGQVLVAQGGRLRAWGVFEGRWLDGATPTTAAATAVALSADGHLVAVTQEGRPTTLWHLPSRRLSWPAGTVRGVGFSQDAANVVVGGDVLTMLDVATRSPQWTIDRPVAAVAISRDGRTAGAFGDTVAVYGPSAEQVTTLSTSGLRVDGTVFTPDGTLLVTVATKTEWGAAKPSALATWSTRTWLRQATVEFGAASRLGAPVVTPDGSRVLVVETALGESRSVVHVLTTADLAEEHRIDAGQEVLDVAVSPDGHQLATVGGDQQVSLWDLRTGRMTARFGQHPGVVRTVAFAPDGTRVATGSADPVVRLWSVADHTLTATLTGHTGEVADLAWAADGTLATADTDGQVGVWDLDPRRVADRLCRAISGPDVAKEWQLVGVSPGTVPC